MLISAIIWNSITDVDPFISDWLSSIRSRDYMKKYRWFKEILDRFHDVYMIVFNLSHLALQSSTLHFSASVITLQNWRGSRLKLKLISSVLIHDQPNMASTSNVKSSHELTLKNYQQQLRDNTKRIYENFIDIINTKTEHVNFEVQVKSAEIVRSYQLLMQLVAEVRSFLIINDLVNLNQQSSSNNSTSSQQASTATQSSALDEKLLKLRDEMSMFLYELEIPLP